MSDDDKRIINDLRRINDLTMWDKVILASQAADRLESLTRTKDSESEECPVCNGNKYILPSIAASGHVKCTYCKGTGRITRAKEVPEGSVEIRVAIATGIDGEVLTEAVSQDGSEDGVTLSRLTHSLDASPESAFIAIARGPYIVIPTIQAEVEVPK